MTGLRILLLSILCLALGNCGFSLRGSDALSAKFSDLQLYNEQTNSEFSRLLRRSLDSADVNITQVTPDEADANIPLLGIASEQLSSRPVTINSRARAAQIELRLSVVLGLQTGEQVLIAPETLFVERIYFQDLENISGNQEEAEIISTEMRRELINQIMRRLSAIDNT
ncbi:MAG: LPS assembly lipoprotein LptE [Pseudohongiellaceae bacterium]